MELKIEHLTPYLPYGLYLKLTDDLYYSDNDNIPHAVLSEGDTIPFNLIETAINMTRYTLEYEKWVDVLLKKTKPLLRPLDNLNKEIIHNKEKFIPMEELKRTLFENQCDAYEEWFEHAEDMGKWTCWLQAPFEIVQLLIEWHFDIFGLIENDLAKKI